MSSVNQEDLTKILANYDKLESLVGKIKNKERRNALKHLASDLKNRFAPAPAATRTEYAGAYPGGLVEQALSTVKLMNELNKTYKSDIPTDSIIVCGLFAHLGKIGTQTQDLYIAKESKWHNDNGIMFELNRKISSVPAPIRSLWWLTSSAVDLDEDEIYAISSLGAMGRAEVPSSELFSAPMLAVALQNAFRVICISSAGRSSITS